MSHARDVRGPAIIVALALLVAGCGGDAETRTITRTVTETETVTAPATTEGGASTASDVACSTSGADLELPEEADLPEPVARTREELFGAALACDFEALGQVAERNEAGFRFTFGAERDPVEYWRRLDRRERILDRLARILTAPSTTTNVGGVSYVWPAVHRDKPSTADYADLVQTGAYSAAEATTFRTSGAYPGYRVGIKADGTWSYFTAGD